MKLTTLFCVSLLSAFVYGQTLENVKNLERSLQKAPTLRDSSVFQLKLSQAYGRAKKDSARYYATMALENAIYIKDDSLIAAAYFQRALPEYYSSNDGVALQYFNKIDSLSERSKKVEKLLIESKVYRSEISKFTFTMEGVLKAKEYLLEGLDLAKEQQDSFYINKLKFHLGSWHGFISQEVAPEKHLDTAERYMKEILPYFIREANNDMVSETYKTLWSIYDAKNNSENAEYYLNQRLLLLKRTRDSLKLGQAYHYYGTYFVRKQEPQLALAYLDSATVVYETIGYPDNTQKKDVLKDEAYALERLGLFEPAFMKLQKAFVLKDDIFRDQNIQAGIEMEAKYQSEKKQQEIALLQSEKELTEQRQRNQRNLLLGAIALALIAFFVVFVLYRNRKRTNSKLRELDQAKSTFFANISHEFRTPITLIKGPIEDQLNQQNLQLSQRKNLLAAQRNTDRLENLVEQLLALSKLESSTMKLQVQPGDLNAFIAVQVEAFQYRATEQNVNFTIHLPDENRTVWFDRDIVEKISFNLIGNAFKYTPEEGSIIVKGSFNNGKYQLQVKNSGIPFSVSEKQEIFKRFYQANAQHTGMGIGLALTKELVELHKGSIVVSEEGNDFIIFTINFSITRNAFTEDEILAEQFQTEMAQSVEIVEPKAMSNVEISTAEDAPILLVVDDNKDILNYVSSIFETEYQVLKATDGKKGFELAKQYIPDLIISDVMMPEEDGFSLTKNLKEHTLTSHIPVILLTSKNRVVDQLEGMGVGADAYITKPFSSQLVKANVSNLIENRRKLQERFSQEVILKPVEIAVTSADQQFLEKLQTVIEENLTNPEFSASQFSVAMGVSRMQLHRKLKALSGQSTSELLRSQRLKAATKLLQDTTLTVSEVGYSVGFNDPSYFTKCFKQEYGMSPTAYTKKSR